jgi:hypothetical protein
MTKLKLGCFIFLFQTVVYAKNVCDTEELLGLVDRPTFARGVCIVPTHKSLLEYGATHFKLIGEGESNSVGEGEYRLGLGRDTELDINPPNYYQQTIDPKAGFGFTTIGLKSIFYQNEHFAFSLDGGLVPSGGSIYFGSRGLHGFINGIWYDEVNDVFAHSFVFGYANYGEYNQIEFEDFGSFNFDYAFSFKLSEPLVWFNEFYGQNKSHTNSGLGIVYSTGLVYLLHPNISFDIRYGQRVVGELNYSTSFIGVGGAFKFF